MRAANESTEQHQRLPPTLEMQFDMTRLVGDVLGVGARFEGEAMRYPPEIDVLG